MTRERSIAGAVPLAGEAGASPRRRATLMPLLQNRALGAATFLVLLCAAFAFTTPHFADLANARTISLNASLLIVVACAESVVVITRNYDLSVGSTAALSAYLGFDLVRRMPDVGPVMVLVPIAIGTLCGLINGAIVGYGRVSSVIATLGTMSVFRGIAFLYANGHQIDMQQLPTWVVASSAANILSIPLLVVLALLVVAAVGAMLHLLPFGRHIYAVGSNPAAASLSVTSLSVGISGRRPRRSTEAPHRGMP